MDAPSMVECSGGRLVVRSLVSGATVFQTQTEAAAAENQHGRAMAVETHPLIGAEMLERQLQMLKNRVVSPLQQLMSLTMPGASRDAELKDLSSNNSSSSCSSGTTSATLSALDTLRGEEELPQCKIKRNYSCNTCAFFTQNPRSHLSHLRDVHGEKIVINECKLCLYASRHFQKLVRHMKMVHGCSDDDSNNSRRHCNRQVRKRRLEESIGAASSAMGGGLVQAAAVAGAVAGVGASSSAGVPSLTQLKSELQMLEQQLFSNVEALNRQQQLQQMITRSGNIFSMAFEFQMCMLPPTASMTPSMSMSMSSSTTDELERDGEHSNTDSEELPQADESEALDLGGSNGSVSITQYQCQKCSYSTPIRARFKKHVKYHSMPLIKCSSCDFHSPYKWNLDRHTKNHGANGYFKCGVCDFSTNIKQSLTIHELNHHSALRRYSTQDQLQAGGGGAGSGSGGVGMHEQFESSELVAMSSASPAKAFDATELPPISCSHCQQTMPNAMELVNHLQQCEPALRSTSHLNTCDIDLTTDEEHYRGKDLSYCGVETAPGYGEVSSNCHSVNRNPQYSSFGQVTEHLQPDDAEALKKVFKCPHCTFWAATASRFHVHIVGHLNRKPFECSLCAYRSNWRWDITKHIRLKAMRDESHIQAQVLMNDETGRRNYAKYNQYLTLMKVSAEQAADAKTMRCGEMHSSSSYDAQIHVQQLDDELALDGHADATLSALDLRISGKSGAIDNMMESMIETNHPTTSYKHKLQHKSRHSLPTDEDQQKVKQVKRV